MDQESNDFSGPFLVSRTGDAGWTGRGVNTSNFQLSQKPQKESSDLDSRKVVMEVEILQAVCNNRPAELGGPENGWR